LTRGFEGVADPRYLLSEIEQLRDIARAAGLSSLDYLLECAAIEARHLAERHRGRERATGQARQDGPLLPRHPRAIVLH
jgi:hypothetical protein